MTLLEAIILGIIQGLTEFLPVSSSGHLELGKALFGGDQIPEESLLFTVMVHAATALSTIVVYRKDIVQLIGGVLKFKWNDEMKYALFIVISMIPVMIVGLFFEKEVSALFDGRIVLVGCMLLVTATLLFLTHRATHREGVIDAPKAGIIGVAQAIAILPGISRSGSTIATSLLLGVSRERAARFSFLMVLPPILGAALLKTMDFFESGTQVSTIDITPLVAGFVAAFVAGVFACRWMVRIVKQSKLSYFALYCAIVGVVAISVGVLVG
ncbi:MAG: undecaprenyl-diphosphate phosphatase [Flavobacteriales bacterium]|nr:undecaprenyl-diphosphate phosphatase [Flavobacteriales bacterium]